MKVVNTQDWPFERMAPYGPAFTAALRKLCARFPDDLSAETIMADIVAGRLQLWLILGEHDEFVAFITTEIYISPFTGRRRLHLCDLAGEGGVQLVTLIGIMEDYARRQGLGEVHAMGRIGWQKALAAQGYRPIIFRYGKELDHGQQQEQSKQHPDLGTAEMGEAGL